MTVNVRETKISTLKTEILVFQKEIISILKTVILVYRKQILNKFYEKSKV